MWRFLIFKWTDPGLMMRYMVEGGGIDSFGLNMPDGMC